MADTAACTCQPEGGLPHGEAPYDYGYDDPADCPVHGKAASAAGLIPYDADERDKGTQAKPRAKVQSGSGVPPA